MTDSAHEASDRAARWLIRQGDPGWTDEQQTEFEAWLTEATLNRVAYLRQREGWRAADRLASLGAANFASIASAPLRKPRVLAVLAIAACLLLVVTAFAVGARFTTPAVIPKQTFATDVGVQNSIPLTDGSRVELNTSTIVQAAISKERREIWLDKGEAYFEVAHKDDLPFIVHAGTRDITVLGTKFSVRRDGAKVIVAVVEGRVKVDRGDEAEASAATIIVAGDVAIAQGASTFVTEQGDDEVERSLAWRGGMLSFADARLADVATEFNRYNARPLHVSRRAANIRIDGAFQASNVQAFVRLLRDAYGLEIKETANSIEISGS
jgi:transmembrane sensor